MNSVLSVGQLARRSVMGDNLRARAVRVDSWTVITCTKAVAVGRRRGDERRILMRRRCMGRWDGHLKRVE